MMSEEVVTRGRCVSLTYVLFDERGEPVDNATAAEPLTYVHGYAQIVPGLEKKLEGLAVGAKVESSLEPAEAFGVFDEEGVFEVERTVFPALGDILIGDEFVAEGVDGERIAMRVVEIEGDSLIVDTNHPLAGQRVRFEVEVTEIRPAAPEEIESAQATEETFRMGRAPSPGPDQNGDNPDEQE